MRLFTILLVVTLSSVQTKTIDPVKTSIKWTGSKIGGKHNGTIQLKEGWLKMDGDKISSGEFIVDMTSIKNTDIENAEYNAKLVGHLKSEDFFGVEKYPNAILKIEKVEEFKNGKALVHSNLTIKENTNHQMFYIVKESGKLKAKIEIDRSKFNVKYGSKSFFDNLGDKVIDDIFTLDIEIEL